MPAFTTKEHSIPSIGNSDTLDRALIFELANCRFIEQHEDALLLGNAGIGKSHIAQAIGIASIHAGFRVLYREAHVLFEDLLLASATGKRTEAIATYSEVPLLIIDDLAMLKTARQPCRRFAQNRDAPLRAHLDNTNLKSAPRRLAPAIWSTPAVAAFLDRLMHHSHLIEIRGKSYRLHEHSLAARNRKAKATT